MNVGFEDEETEGQPVEVFTPDGKKLVLKSNILNRNELSSDDNETDFKNDPSLVKGSFVIFPEELKQFNYLDISKKITEFGNDR